MLHGPDIPKVRVNEMPVADRRDSETDWASILESWADSVVAREASQVVVMRGPLARAVNLPFRALGIVARYRRDHGWRQTGVFLRGAIADRVAARR